MTPQDWENGKSCPQHGLPYCTPCFQALIRLHYASSDKADDAAVDRIHKKVIATLKDSAFHRPTRREYFMSTFALHLQLNGYTYLMPLSFIIIESERRAWKADREESITILRNEERWSTGVPVWAQNVTPNFTEEDLKLLRGMKISV